MLSKNIKGFTLAGVMVTAGILGVLSVAFMQLTKNMNDSQSFAVSKADEIELRAAIRLLLNDERHCRVSLAGDGPAGNPDTPVTFFKEDIDEDHEGLDIALYLSNQVGDARGLKKFNGSNNPGADDKSKYGKLKITSVKLIMNNGIGSNYPMNANNHEDIGTLRVIAEKKSSSSTTKKVVMNFDVNVGMSTDSSEETTILSCGPQLLPPPAQTTVIAVHSQTTTSPVCPTGWASLWDGYSFFIGAGTGGYNGSPDLGEAGSCLKEFRPMPFIECKGNSGGSCDYVTGGDYSFWLTTVTVPEGSVSGPAMLSRISRCKVCEGTTPIIAVHSQSELPPTCPLGWTSQWDGYSFFIGAGGGGYNGSADLAKVGSCLREFRPMPFIECKGSGSGSCDYVTSGDHSYWLATKTVDESSVNGASMLSRISRCKVCAKDTAN